MTMFEKKKSLSKLLFQPSRVGKMMMQQAKWDNLQCTECGGELKLIRVNKFEEVKECTNCGKRHMLIKKIRKEREEEW